MPAVFQNLFLRKNTKIIQCIFLIENIFRAFIVRRNAISAREMEKAIALHYGLFL